MRPGEFSLLGPVFIVGSPRSGTSILVEALQKAGYAGFSEGNFLSLLHPLNRLIDQHFANFSSNEPEVLINHLSKDALKGRLFGAIREQVNGLFDERPWLDKTGNPEMIAAIPVIRVLWPGSVFIFAKRRGLENVVSRIKKFPHFDFAYHCADWTKNMMAWRQLRTAVPDLPCIEVDQRDIAHAAEAVAGKIADFLQLSPEQQGLVQTTFETSRPQQSDPDSSKRVLSLPQTGWNGAQQEMFRRLCGGAMRAYEYTEDESYRSAAK